MLLPENIVGFSMECGMLAISRRNNFLELLLRGSRFLCLELGIDIKAAHN